MKFLRFLRTVDCKYLELVDKHEFSDFSIFCQYNPFGELPLKINKTFQGYFALQSNVKYRAGSETSFSVERKLATYNTLVNQNGSFYQYDLSHFNTWLFCQPEN